jgi:hypothetical protein
MAKRTTIGVTPATFRERLLRQLAAALAHGDDHTAALVTTLDERVGLGKRV